MTVVNFLGEVWYILTLILCAGYLYNEYNKSKNNN